MRGQFPRPRAGRVQRVNPYKSASYLSQFRRIGRALSHAKLPHFGGSIVAFRETSVPSKRIAIAMFVVLCVQTLGVRALAAAEGELKGRVVRSRDSQPIPGAPVQ